MAYTPYEDIEFQTRYSLTEAPTASGAYVAHSLTTQYSADGEEWTDDRQIVINVLAPDLEAVLVMNNGAAKVTAYKELLKNNRNTRAVVFKSVADGAIQKRANDLARAEAAAAGADEYIIGVGGDYPVNFTL
jgi:hypothetical protein